MLRTNSRSFKKKMPPFKQVQKYSSVQRIKEVGERERECIIMNLKNKERYGRTNLRIRDEGLR